jgi:hypothetical protein
MLFDGQLNIIFIKKCWLKSVYIFQNIFQPTYFYSVLRVRNYVYKNLKEEKREKNIKSVCFLF